VKYAFICGEEGNYPVAKMCRWAKVSRSGYYEWHGRGPSSTELRRRRLATLVAWSFKDSDGTYGYRRVRAHLARVGQHADPETIRLLMRELALVPCQPGPWRPTTTVAGDVASTPDLLRRDFTCNTPATKLVGDITYIRTWEGWLYLATVLDCHTKQVLGYAMADHLRTALVTDALAMAARKVTIRAGVTVFHSDRGCQYTSQEFADTTDQLGLVRSLGRTGTCYDNAWAESFNGTLKNERVNRTVYPTKDHARIDITRYIELRYNQKRLHSALGYITPNEAEQNWFRDNRAAKNPQQIHCPENVGLLIMRRLVSQAAVRWLSRLWRAGWLCSCRRWWWGPSTGRTGGRPGLRTPGSRLPDRRLAGTRGRVPRAPGLLRGPGRGRRPRGRCGSAAACRRASPVGRGRVRVGRRRRGRR